ncbi:MAG: hypothetical protein M1831_004623 [Alyxoria varia]|nr:MAG: hypothetical protein M1831_004623 [Alyxoria varia]
MSDDAKIQPSKDITLTTTSYIALITLNLPHKLNALTPAHYFHLANLLNHVATLPEITVTVITGTGRFFSAGADVSLSRSEEPSTTSSSTSTSTSTSTPTDAAIARRKDYNSSFVANNLHNTHAFATHPKILIAALNGPCVGYSAAMVAHADFIYAAPHTFLLTPFTSLGLVAEGGASKAFVERMGWARANEALIASKRLTCEELVGCGFVNKVFEAGGGDKATGKGGFDSSRFLQGVMEEVRGMLDPANLNHEAVLGVKRLIREPWLKEMGDANQREVWGGLEAFVRGDPQREFERLKSGSKRHKL